MNLEYPGKFKVYGIGIDEIGYQQFAAEKYFNHEVFINRNKTIYEALKFKKPGILSCFGFCVKNVFKKQEEYTKRHRNKNMKPEFYSKQDFTQMGGSFLINSKGEVLLEHVDSFYGDHAKEEDIVQAIRNYLGTGN